MGGFEFKNSSEWINTLNSGRGDKLGSNKDLGEKLCMPNPKLQLWPNKKNCWSPSEIL